VERNSTLFLFRGRKESAMPVRGVRGATTVTLNREDEILTVTRVLLQEMVQANQMAPDDLAAAFFTVTPDLDAAFPARAARDLGWVHVPMLDSTEIGVPGSLRRCIRVLLLWNTDRAPAEIRHVYQREAVSLRPDLSAPTLASQEMKQ
jgi:chorismate mutase